MKEITVDSSQVSYCGLYCGACNSFRKEKCPGCHENTKTSWCKIRLCCMENNYSSCADCKAHQDPNDCKLFNNFMAKIFGFIFRSNRKASIEMIRAKGIDGFAQEMTAAKQMCPKR